LVEGKILFFANFLVVVHVVMVSSNWPVYSPRVLIQSLIPVVCIFTGLKLILNSYIFLRSASSDCLFLNFQILLIILLCLRNLWLVVAFSNSYVGILDVVSTQRTLLSPVFQLFSKLWFGWNGFLWLALSLIVFSAQSRSYLLLWVRINIC
jgi:hypothetical protein